MVFICGWQLNDDNRISINEKCNCFHLMVTFHCVNQVHVQHFVASHGFQTSKHEFLTLNELTNPINIILSLFIIDKFDVLFMHILNLVFYLESE
jgi:hypothetical protein